MSSEIYEKAVEDSFSKLKDSLSSDITDPEFNWDLLIEMLIIENTPLAEVFSKKTIQFAELYSTAQHLSTVAYYIDNEDIDTEDEQVVENITKADIEVSESKPDDFVDFEDA
jgi:hypothetical protein